MTIKKYWAKLEEIHKAHDAKLIDDQEWVRQLEALDQLMKENS